MGVARRARRSVVGAGAAAVVLAGGGAAWAATTLGGGAPVHACYGTSTGAVRLIDPSKGQSCTSTEGAVDLASTDAAGRVGDAERVGGVPAAGLVHGTGSELVRTVRATVTANGYRGDVLVRSPEAVVQGECSGQGGRFADVKVTFPAPQDIQVFASYDGQATRDLGLGQQQLIAFSTDEGHHITWQVLDVRTGTTFHIDAYVSMIATIQSVTCVESVHVTWGR